MIPIPFYCEPGNCWEPRVTRLLQLFQIISLLLALPGSGFAHVFALRRGSRHQRKDGRSVRQPRRGRSGVANEVWDRAGIAGDGVQMSQKERSASTDAGSRRKPIASMADRRQDVDRCTNAGRASAPASVYLRKGQKDRLAESQRRRPSSITPSVERPICT